jgi:hypothetical protein
MTGTSTASVVPWGGEIRTEPQAYFELGEHTLALSVHHSRGRLSGVELEAPDALVVRWRDDLIVYLRSYVGKKEALRDLGVSEDALEPIAP